MNTKNNDCAFPKFTLFNLTLANFGVLASFFLLFLNLLNVLTFINSKTLYMNQ